MKLRKFRSVAIALVFTMLISTFALIGCDQKKKAPIDSETAAGENVETTTAILPETEDTYVDTEDIPIVKDPTDITLDADSIILDNKGKGSITVTVMPEDATDRSVSAYLVDSDGVSVTVGEPVGNTSVILLEAKGVAGKYILSVKTADMNLKKNVTVYVKEEAPQLSISYVSEKLIGVTSGVTYKISGSGIGASSITSDGVEMNIAEDWYGKTLDIVRVNSEENCNSTAQTISIPARPSAPTLTKTDASSAMAIDGSIMDVSTAMEYKKQGDSAWSGVAGTAINGIGVGTYLVRYKGTNSAFASAVATVVIGYGKVMFTDSNIFDVPAGDSGTAFEVNVSAAVSGGKAPYAYTVSGPSWITVDASGKLIATRPSTEQAATTATLTVTDADGSNSSITISVGAVSVPHVHSIQTKNAKSATCTEGGNILYYYCTGSCGKYFSDAEGTVEIVDKGSVEIAALGHDYSEEIEDAAHIKVKSQSCQVYHVYWYDCSRCDASAKNDAAATDKFYTGSGVGAGHSSSAAWKKDSNGHWKECVCGAKINSAAHTDADSNKACDTCAATLIMISGNNISQYKIIYYDSVYAKECAQSIQKAIADRTGITLTVASDSATVSAYEILVGKTNRNESKAVRGEYDRPNVNYDVVEKNGKLVIMAEGFSTLEVIADKFADYITKAKDFHSISGSVISGDVLISDNADNVYEGNMLTRHNDTDVRIMAWNMGGPGTYGKLDLAEKLADTILKNLPDVLGTNEFYDPKTGNYRITFDAVLREISEYYYEIESDNDFPNDSRLTSFINARGPRPQKIFIRKDAGLKVIAAGWRYTDYQSTVDYRSFPWAVLETKDGDRFIYTVSHYTQMTSATTAAVEQLEAVAYAQAQSGSSETLPVILSGDLWMKRGAGSHQYFVNNGYKDAQVNALVNDNNNTTHSTFHDYGVLQPTGRAITDFIMYSSGISPLKFKVVTSREALDSSDHSPLCLDMKFN